MRAAAVLAALSLVAGAAVDAAEAAPSTTPSPATQPAAPSVAPAPARAAGERSDAPRWDYLPIVGYPGDALRFALRVGDSSGWSALSHQGALALEPAEQGAVAQASLVPSTRPEGAEWIELASGERRLRVHLVRPGAGGPLVWTPERGLRQGEDPAVLVVDRTEAEQDRRWRAFRSLGGVEPVRCRLRLEAPPMPAGEPALLALVAASQALAVRGENVLVLLPGADRHAGWKHREYRQAVAWAVSDLLMRGAAHVVLAGPIAPAVDAQALAPLRRQIADVAQAYRCRTLALGEVCDDAMWEVAPGVLGPALNARGQETLAQALADWTP